MTLTELLAEVYSETRRADLVSQTLSAVRSATLKAHRIDYFYKDLFETGISFTPADYVHQVDYKTLYPRFRSLKYLRKFDPTALPAPGQAGTYFNVIDPTDALDPYNVTKEDVCYIAGVYLQIRSSTLLSNALIGFYQDPLIGSTDGTFSSWIAVDHPWAIIRGAASQIFKIVGKTTEMRAQDELLRDEYQILKQTNIVNQGY